MVAGLGGCARPYLVLRGEFSGSFRRFRSRDRSDWASKVAMCGPPFRLLGSRWDQGTFFSALESSRRGLHTHIFFRIFFNRRERCIPCPNPAQDFSRFFRFPPRSSVPCCFWRLNRETWLTGLLIDFFLIDRKLLKPKRLKFFAAHGGLNYRYLGVNCHFLKQLLFVCRILNRYLAPRCPVSLRMG
jgi:hypothetical protein